MSEKEFKINISKLEEAKNTSNSQWLEETFAKASDVIAAGGIVNLIQQYSDSHLELVSVIDNMEALNHYIKKYSI
jgi:hypothetical protein